MGFIKVQTVITFWLIIVLINYSISVNWFQVLWGSGRLEFLLHFQRGDLTYYPIIAPQKTIINVTQLTMSAGSINRYFEKCETYSYKKGIYTCCKCQHKKYRIIKRTYFSFRFSIKSFIYHLNSNKNQKTTSNPLTISRNIVFYCVSTKPAQYQH